MNASANESFLLSAQSPMGGFAKEPGEYPDPFHSYLALAALALGENRKTWGLKELDARWNVGVDTALWIRDEMGRFENDKSS